MRLNKDWRTLVIPFASKGYVSTLKDYKNSFKGIAYYVFDKEGYLIYSTAELIEVESFASESKKKTSHHEKEWVIKRNNLFKKNKLDVKNANKIIDNFNLNVKDACSLVYNHNPTGSFVGSGFHKDQIFYFDEENVDLWGWRFSTALSKGGNKVKLKKSDKEEVGIFLKYEKIKYSNLKLTLKKVKSFKKIELKNAMNKNEKLKRLLFIYNDDLISEENKITPYSDEAELIRDNFKKAYSNPKKNDVFDLLYGYIKVKGILNKDFFESKISSYRNKFKRELKMILNENSKEEVLNKHRIPKICDASHIYDVHLIKEEIQEIINKSNINNFPDYCKLKNKVDEILLKISDTNNGVFLDATTHRYFDSNLLFLKTDGTFIDKTDTQEYLQSSLNLSKEQVDFLKQRNLKRCKEYNEFGLSQKDANDIGVFYEK